MKQLGESDFYGALIDPEFKGKGGDEDEDDVDVIHVTGRKLPAIYPILKPAPTPQIMATVQKYVAVAVQDFVISFTYDPSFGTIKPEEINAPGDEENDEVFPWLMNFTPLVDQAIPIQEGI